MRGANDPTKRLGIKNFFKEGKGEIVCFQETKMTLMYKALVKDFWGSVFVFQTS